MLIFFSYKFIFFFKFMNTVGTKTVQNQMVWSLMNNELEKLRKEVDVA